MDNSKKSPSTSQRAPRFLLLMPEEIRGELDKCAFSHGRTLTAEINIRLRDSLKTTPAPSLAPAPHPMSHPHTSNVVHTNEKSPVEALSDLDRAMLRVFHGLPPEKQLALLSLFKN